MLSTFFTEVIESLMKEAFTKTKFFGSVTTMDGVGYTIHQIHPRISLSIVPFYKELMEPAGLRV